MIFHYIIAQIADYFFLLDRTKSVTLCARHGTISSLAPLFLIPWLRISSPQFQAGCGEGEREYDYIVVGVRVLFNR